MVKRIADQLRDGVETVRIRVRQAEIDVGQTAGVSTVRSELIKVLKPENSENRRVNAALGQVVF